MLSSVISLLPDYFYADGTTGASSIKTDPELTVEASGQFDAGLLK